MLKGYESKGYEPADTDPIYFEAETPDKVSNYTIYPIYDRSSAITSPQDKSKILRNTMGGDKWVTNGQWISYSFECEESGLYQIGIRFSQDVLKGMYTSRAVRIDGEYPFEEAKACQFPYDNKWQTGYLGDGNNEFRFYLEKGTHTIELEVCLGSLSDVVRQVDSVVNSLNNDYMSIVELTGADPDEYRDYGFTRIMPDVIADLGIQSSILYQLVDYISEINGIKSDNTSTLEQAAVLVEKMSSDEKEIAANLSSLKEWVSSLGTWLSDVSTQYLEMDYIIIQPADSELPRAEANGWQSFLHVTIPMLSPTIFFCLVTQMISSFKVFDIIIAMTQGGPGRATNVLAYFVYNKSFMDSRFGYASAAAFVMFAIIMVFTAIQFIGQKKWVNY